MSSVQNFDGRKVYLKRMSKPKKTVDRTESDSSPNTNTESDSLSSIKIAHTNINSIRNKIEHISAELSDYDIICVSETKLNASIPTSQILIDGYMEPIRKDRVTNSGGGLAIYLKNNIYFTRRLDLENNNIESIWIEIHSLKNKSLLGLFYRPPNSANEFWDYFEETLENASDHNLDLLILGDFNHDILKHGNTGKLNRIMPKFNLQHIINNATRITENTQTCIDLIMSNHISTIINSEILTPFDSDHCTVTAEISSKVYKAQSYKKTVWRFEEADVTSIEHYLNSTDWSFIQRNNNINIITEQFEEILHKTAENHIPKKTFTVRPNDKPWMTTTIRKHMRQRNRLYHKAKLKNSTFHWQKFKNKRNEVVELVRQAKQDYKKKLQTSLSDPNLPQKSWYRIVNDITKLKNKQSPPPPLIKDNTINLHPFDKAETLNKHFADISRTENEPPLPDEPIPPNFNLRTIHVSVQDVKDQLHKLNISKPAGPDDIMPKFIKLISNYIYEPLTSLFNRSLELGQVPNQWKMANISAIFKGKGNDQDPSNYRPISITSCLGKILEKIIFKYLYNYLQENNILSKFQSGFKPNDSTVNQLLEIYHIMLENMDKGKELKFIFCDVSKAFDKVWHRGLLYKLKKYGICDTILKWFTSYLLERKQRVSNEGFYSTWLDTSAGVPQGSVLGPYLFLLYINDIVDNISSNIRLFADDTSLFTVIENDDSIKILNNDVYKIAKWSKDWCIILNPTKTSTMTFTRKRNTNLPNIKMDETVLQDEKYHTHLGLTFSSDASWDEHVQTIYSKAASRLNILRMLKHDLDRKSLFRFYITYIRPTLEYGDIIWNNINQQNSQLLESIQLDACRIITGLRKGTSHDTLYNELGLCPLSERRKHHKLIYFYKVLNNEVPTYIDNILVNYNLHQSDYNMRSNKLKHPTPRTKAFQDSYFISTIDLWNELPPELSNATSLYSFKRILNKSLPKPPKYYSHGLRKYNIIICQLRNSKSQLNSDLYCDHLEESPFCTNCNSGSYETSQHYFFECTSFQLERSEMINSLIFSPTIYSKIPKIDAKNLLSGVTDISPEDNEKLIEIIIAFIHQSGRFG